MQKVIRETNEYAKMVTDPATMATKGGKRWTPLTLSEFRIFHGIVIFMGVKRLPAMRDYWRRTALHCKIVAKAMARDRFEAIMRCLHLVNRDEVITDRQHPCFDPLAKVRWLIDDLVANFQKYQNPDVHMAVDKCMIPYAGRYCPSKQFIPSKPTRYGIKVWQLASSDSKYCFNLEVYVGKMSNGVGARATKQPVLPWIPGTGHGVVSRLTSSLQRRWHIIAIDNFFSSPLLFEDMYKNGFLCIGTLRANRQGPSNIPQHRPQ